MTDNGSPADANAASESAEEFPAKLRVHALARALGLTSRKVLEHLAELGNEARSPQSSIDRAAANAVRDRIGDDAGAPVAEAVAAADVEAVKVEQAAVVEQAPSLFSAAQMQRHEPLTPPASGEEVSAGRSPLFLPPEAFVPPPAAPPTPPAPLAAVEDEPTVDEPQVGAVAAESTPATEDDSAKGKDTDADNAGSTDNADSTDSSDDDNDDNSDGGRNRRRRRGRRGRGRGRGEQNADGDASDESQDGESADEKADTKGEAKPQKKDDTADSDTGSDESDADASDADASDDGDGEPTSKRRRRRRRRKGGAEAEDGSSPDDPPNTVVHEREPRSKRARDEVQGISGSTRLEAKRQRRRDGRDAGRRRPPILSESEFLARREAVDRVMVVRERGPVGADQQGAVEDYTQVAVLEDGVLVEHFVTTETSSSMVGNIYLGRVQNVLPGMEAAFVDIGRGRNGVLYAGEVNWDAAGLDGGSRKIEQALKPGDNVLVQVSKDPVGHKGARLTTQISLAGRYLVYVPGGSSTGISRKLPDTERKRLRSILGKLVPDDAGVIIRTASEGVSAEELGADIERLESQWQTISTAVSEAEAKKGSSPKALYEEPDLLVRVVRDLFNEDFRQLVVEGPKAWNLVERYVSDVAPDLMERVEKFEKSGPDAPDSFVVHRIDEQLAKALDRKVWLPSGGTLIIEHTEAMTVVDVNTGKFTGSGGNLEETVTRNNLEAAEEIVRQMRLRDIGGMIIVDFIDMVLESNRDLVLRRLTEALARDRTRHQVSEVTSLGLVQMTRKRLGTGLLEAFSTTCTHCGGRGVIVHANPIEVRGSDDAPTRSDGGSSKRSRRKGRKTEAPVETPASDDERVDAAHHAGEHPMFRAMAAHAHDHDEEHDIEVLERSDETVSVEAAVEGAQAQPRVEPAAETVVDKPVDEPKVAVTETVKADKTPPVVAEPARPRRRRAARRPAASTGTAGTTIVIGANETPDAPESAPITTVGHSPTPVAPIARRPRRRGAGRPAGPPVEGATDAGNEVSGSQTAAGTSD